jgi:prepilin signal peptidase PulO-like enzyme (type II secretory pathway)
VQKASTPPAALLGAAVQANVRWAIRTLHESPHRKARLKFGEVKLAGAAGALSSSRVRFLE